MDVDACVEVCVAFSAVNMDVEACVEVCVEAVVCSGVDA